MTEEYIVERPQLTNNKLTEAIANVVLGIGLFAAIGVLAIQGTYAVAEHMSKKVFKRRRNAF